MTNIKKYAFSPALSDEELKALVGERATDQHFRTIITEDADAYDVRTARLIFRFRKGVLSESSTTLARQIFGNIDERMDPSWSRNTAAGRLDLQRVQEFRPEVVAVHPNPEKPFEGQFELSSGKRLESMRCNPVRSFMAGYRVDRRNRGCPAGFSKEFPADWEKAIPFFEAIGDALDRHMHYEARRMHRWCERHSVKPAFTIGRTCLSTVAINVNYDSAYHYDGKDMRDGYSTLTAVGVGSYTGGYLVLPGYGIAVDVQPGDVLFNTSHRDLHGNTPVHADAPEAKRISFVTFLREEFRYAGNRDVAA